LYFSYQANNIATQANSIAFNAYSVVNNYPPYIDVSSNDILILRPMNCRQHNTSYVECELGGTFSINVTVIAPHNGIFDLTATVSGIGPFSQRANYFVGGRTSVQVGNATITMYPLLRLIGPVHGLVQGGVPAQKTIEGQLAGLDVLMPSRLPANPVSGVCTLTAVLTYVDVQTQGAFPRSFTMQGQILLAEE
jgi:hypothetical protein